MSTAQKWETQVLSVLSLSAGDAMLKLQSSGSVYKRENNESQVQHSTESNKETIDNIDLVVRAGQLHGILMKTVWVKGHSSDNISISLAWNEMEALKKAPGG